MIDKKDSAAEGARLVEVARFQAMDTLEDQAYDDLTRLAAQICGAPIALISIVESDRQWFRSRVGLQIAQTPREHSFCAHVIAQPDTVMVIGDTLKDSRFADNPLVTGEPNIRFYAGAPLLSATGHALGTLCVIDRQARRIEPDQLETLRFLASQVMQRLEEHRQALGSGAGAARSTSGRPRRAAGGASPATLPDA